MDGAHRTDGCYGGDRFYGTHRPHRCNGRYGPNRSDRTHRPDRCNGLNR